MNLVEEKQGGLISLGLQSWPLQLIEHLANTTSVAPPPAGPVGCCPLYLLHLLNLSFTIWAPNRCWILQFRVYQSLYAPSSCKGNLKSNGLSCFGRSIRVMLTPIHVLCDCYTKIFCGRNVFQSLLMQSGHE